MAPRTTGAIALGSTYNLQKGYKFFSLNTGKVIYRKAFTTIQLSSDVKNHVEEMAEKEGRPSKLFFMDRNGENEEDVEESDTDDDNNNEIINVDNDDYQVEDDQSEDNNEDEQEEEEDDNQNQVTTRSGRIIRQPNNYIPSFNGQRYEELINNNIQFNETLEYDDNFVHVFEKVINHHIFKKYR